MRMDSPHCNVTAASAPPPRNALPFVAPVFTPSPAQQELPQHPQAPEFQLVRPPCYASASALPWPVAVLTPPDRQP